MYRRLKHKGGTVKMYSEAQEASAPFLRRRVLSGKTMGTRYSAVFFAEAGLDETAVGAALFAAVDKVDCQMSTWKPDSDLSRLNALPSRQWLAVPEELLTVLDTAMRIGEQSEGAFDIGVGDLVNAWGFGPSGSVPDEHQTRVLEKHLRYSASDALEIDHEHKRVRKRMPIALDLSGIAKGYGVDGLACCLDSFGITSYLVGIDGEMRAKGMKPDGKAWAVAIEKPVPHVREVIGVMELVDAAIATSGDYRHWVDLDGRRHAHTMDPIERQPACNRLAAVSVVMPSCMLADAWATAFLVLGETAGVELAQKRGMSVLFVLHDGETFQEIVILDGQHQI